MRRVRNRGQIMRFAIVLKDSHFVVRRFQAVDEAGAKNVFKKFLKDGVKDDCCENYLLKSVVQKRVCNNE